MNKKVFLSKKFFVLWIFISIFSFCVFPEDKKNTETWQISPMVFSGKTEYQELIPKLILQAFPENITRVLTYEEQKIAYEDFIKAEKEKLENKIQSLKTEKDQLFFKNTAANSKAKKRAEIESQIKELSEQLQKIEIENSFEYKEKDAKIVFDTTDGYPLLQDANFSKLSAFSSTLDFTHSEKLKVFRALDSGLLGIDFADGV